MNWRAAGTIRRGLRRGESGQAFAELAVSLVAILAAFIGFLLVAAVSSDRVSVLINARENADRDSAAGFSSQEGERIASWDYGDDRIPFTADDRKQSGSPEDGAYFKDQLSDNTRLVSLLNPPSSSSMKNDFSSLQDSNLFLNAAGLVEGRDSTSDTFRKHDISSIENGIQWLFGIDSVRIEEKVYMPTRSRKERRD